MCELFALSFAEAGPLRDGALDKAGDAELLASSQAPSS